jgi:hypothetical protein
MTSSYQKLLAFCAENKQGDFSSLLSTQYKTSDLFKFLRRSETDKKKDDLLLKVSHAIANKSYLLEKAVDQFDSTEKTKSEMYNLVYSHAQTSSLPGLPVLADKNATESTRLLAAIEYLKKKCPGGEAQLKSIEREVKASVKASVEGDVQARLLSLQRQLLEAQKELALAKKQAPQPPEPVTTDDEDETLMLDSDGEPIVKKPPQPAPPPKPVTKKTKRVVDSDSDDAAPKPAAPKPVVKKTKMVRQATQIIPSGN